MKKKILPYILGCSLAAVLPFAAYADTDNIYYHTGNDIETNGMEPWGGGETNWPDWNENDTWQPIAYDESHNEFTEYNSAAETGLNERSKTFGTPSISNHTVSWQASSLGNTRQTTATTQAAYDVTIMNEKQDYRSDPSDPSTLAEDLDYAAEEDPDDNLFNTQDNADEGITALETSIPEFTMTIPAKTVLPMGATLWRIGNVKINGTNFIRPDKIQLLVNRFNFHHENYDGTKPENHADNVPKVIPFDVLDKSGGSSIVYVDNNTPNFTYFFQDGGNNLNPDFPHSYTSYTSADYEAGLTSDINETHQVWVKPSNGAWSGKTAGKYTGSILFVAEVVTTDSEDMYTNKYPAEPAIQQVLEP